MASTPTIEKGSFPWVMIILWVIFSCLLSGVVAAVLDMPSLWGSRSSVLEYMLPLPFSWGMLHYPSLGLFGLLLVLVSTRKDLWLSILRLLCMGSLLAVLAVVTISEELRGFPLFMYIAVDAFTALSFALLFFANPVEHTKRSIGFNLSLILGPTFLVLLMLFSAPMFMSRYNFAKSDTMEIDSKQDVVQFWVYLNHGAGKPQKECSYLMRYAEDRKTSYPRNNGLRHRKILLFKTIEALRAGSPASAWVSYEWWPDGRVSCSADARFGSNFEPNNE